MKKIDRNLDLTQVKKDITTWIKTYCEQNNITSLVVGVSGGIDSALVSTLCANTGIKTYTILLPLNQKLEQTERGENHIKWLLERYPNVVKLKIDLSKTFETFKNTMEPELHNDLAFANTKSRLRMTTLYQVAQSKNGIVVGTGNKVEDFGIGFFTKYGDGGVDISPIADLYKSEVYAIAKSFGVIDEILTAKPTDGLWDDDRNDETQIGATYDELEWAMQLEDKTNVNALTQNEQEILKIYQMFNNKNKHKMVSIPTFKVL
jgi:NAD+ synthase